MEPVEVFVVKVLAAALLLESGAHPVVRLAVDFHGASVFLHDRSIIEKVRQKRKVDNRIDRIGKSGAIFGAQRPWFAIDFPKKAFIAEHITVMDIGRIGKNALVAVAAALPPGNIVPLPEVELDFTVQITIAAMLLNSRIDNLLSGRQRCLPSFGRPLVFASPQSQPTKAAYNPSIHHGIAFGEPQYSVFLANNALPAVFNFTARTKSPSYFSAEIS